MTSFTLSQQKALYLDRHIFVEAGAGSGKTTILVERYLSIFEANSQLDMSEVVAFTFSQKAAAEMRHRVMRFPDRIPAVMSRAAISTIHSYAIEILREFGYWIGIDPGFRIVDEIERRALITQSVDTMLGVSTSSPDQPLMTSLRQYLAEASVKSLRTDLMELFAHPQWKPLTREDWPHRLDLISSAEDRTYTQAAVKISSALASIFEVASEEFSRLKRQFGALDFDDAISFSVELLTSCPQVLIEMRSRIRFMMVDEFQDTDPTQWRLVELLSGFSDSTASSPANLFVVGDVKQSIYGFRGADAALFLQVQKQFQERSDSDVVILADNFRSDAHVVAHVNAVFEPLFETLGSQVTPYHHLVPYREAGDWPVSSFVTGDLHELAVADHIASLLTLSSQLKPHDIAVLLRGYAHAPALKLALEVAGVPAVIHSIPGFYQQDDAVWGLNVLKALLDGSDYLSWYAVFSYARVGVGHHILMAARQRYPQDLFLTQLEKLILELDDSEGVDRPRILSLIRESRHLVERSAIESLPGILRAITRVFISEDACEQLPVFTQLHRQFSEFESKSMSLPTCVQFLEDGVKESASLPLSMSQLPQGVVQIMTIHASKGLEFPVVVMPYCHQKFRKAGDRVLYSKEWGLCLQSPSSKSKSVFRENCVQALADQTIEDEKKLFYVACTRAKQGLYFFSEKMPDREGPLNSYAAFLLQSGVDDCPQFYSRAGASFQALPVERSSRTPQLIETGRDISGKLSVVLPLTVSETVAMMVGQSQFRIAPDLGVTPTISAELYGTLLHRVYYRGHMMGVIPSREWVIAELRAVGGNAQLWDKTATRLLSSIEKYWASDLCLQLKDPHAQFEHPVSMTLLLPSGVTVLLEGRFDGLVVTDSEVRVVDFKTAASLDRENPLSEEYLHQMKLYLLLAMTMYPGRLRYKATVYFTEHEFLSEIVETEETLGEFKTLISTKIRL